MRTSAAAVLASVAINGALGCWFARQMSREPPALALGAAPVGPKERAKERDERDEPARAEPEPIVVTFLPASEERAAAREAPARDVLVRAPRSAMPSAPMPSAAIATPPAAAPSAANPSPPAAMPSAATAMPSAATATPPAATSTPPATAPPPTAPPPPAFTATASQPETATERPAASGMSGPMSGVSGPMSGVSGPASGVSGGGAGHDMLAMRPRAAPSKPGLIGLSETFLDHIGADTKDIADIPGARIERDVDAIESRLADPHYTATASPGQLSDDRWELVRLREERAKVELHAQKDGTYTAEKEAYGVRVNRDGTVAIRDKPSIEMKTPFLYKIKVTDALMRATGHDPYASEKRKFLDRTREQRAAIGTWNRIADLAHSGQLMSQNLAWAWRISTTLAAKKQAMFDLWDECAEPGADRADETGVAARSGDDALVDGGNAARREVIAFVRTKLTGPDAYTPAELAQLNAHRRSREAFSPYE